MLSQNWISNTLKNSSLILCWVLPSQAQNELDHSSFQGRSIFIYIYTFIKPGQYLRFWNNFARYLCCFTSSSDTASHKEIWVLKTITGKNRNYFTPTSLEFFLKKTFFWEKCRNKLKIPVLHLPYQTNHTKNLTNRHYKLSHFPFHANIPFTMIIEEPIMHLVSIFT